MGWKQTFFAVTTCALAGMVLGGLFGLAAGRLAPDLFHLLIPWEDIEPVGIAIVMGATVGVILGGSLGCFGIIIQLLLEWRKANRAP